MGRYLSVLNEQICWVKYRDFKSAACMCIYLQNARHARKKYLVLSWVQMPVCSDYSESLQQQ